MEGACVYLVNNKPKISIYKEIESNKILHVEYYNKVMNFCFITCKQLTNILPKDCIHIMTKLPYYSVSLNKTLSKWRNLTLNKLILLNNDDYNDYSNYKL
tara:strand:- start:1217 stop:1516 length:300 start_codon:yes stop_codon:yes gene_type:complete